MAHNDVPRNGNGMWRNWALGIAATLIVSLIINGITFQRDTKEKLATNEARIRALETRAREAIIREFERVDKRLDKLEQGAQPRPGYKLQSEESRPFDPDELRR
jgi:hypothetical protein